MPTLHADSACSCQTGDRSCKSQREILGQFVQIGASFGALVPMLVLCHWATEPSTALGAIGCRERVGGCAGCFGQAAAIGCASITSFGDGRRVCSCACGSSSCRIGARSGGCRVHFCRRACARTRSGARAGACSDRRANSHAQRAAELQRSLDTAQRVCAPCAPCAQRISLAELGLCRGALGRYAGVHVASAARKQACRGARS